MPTVKCDFRNESYIAHVRLAVIDYNAHVDREVARNREGDTVSVLNFMVYKFRGFRGVNQIHEI